MSEMEMLFSTVSISREEVFCLLGCVSSPSHSFDFPHCPHSCTVSSLKRWNAFQVGLMTVIYPASVGSVSQVAATWEKRSALYASKTSSRVKMLIGWRHSDKLPKALSLVVVSMKEEVALLSEEEEDGRLVVMENGTVVAGKL